MTKDSNMSLRRGSLIVFEGLDRTGKSTLATRLTDALGTRVNRVGYLKFPDRSTRIGEVIDGYLKQNIQLDDHAIHLLFSANRWELKDKMCELLKQGTTLIVDRYSYSGIAYSVAKNTQGLTYEWCRSSEIGLPRPDMIVFLTLGSEAQKARVGFGGERYEETSFQERVANCYTRLRQTEADRWLDVNVEGKSPKQLLEEIIVPVMNCIECNGHKQLSIIEQN